MLNMNKREISPTAGATKTKISMVMDPDTSYNLDTKQPSCKKSKDEQKSESRLTWQKKSTGEKKIFWWLLDSLGHTYFSLKP